MEGFSDLLHKLQEVHEREVEGWQVKVQELSNKKGCDTKRMEELFSRNQQMKEQQRLLTENIKTLENRLRAGLCDRCTVTQEVAKKRQQEYEASHIQSLQHMSLLAGEMNSLKKENKRLRDEIRTVRAALEGHSDHSSGTTEVKSHSSPDMSPSPVPAALVTANSVGGQPSDRDGAANTEADHKSEETEHRQSRGTSRSHFESSRTFPLSVLKLPPRKTEHAAARFGERRASSVEELDQRAAILPHPMLLKGFASPPGEATAGRHVLHAPVPCRPQPIKGSPVSLPWSLSEPCDWANVAAAAGAGSSMVLSPPPKPNLIRLPNVFPAGQHAGLRRHGHPWHAQFTSQAPAKEPTVVFRLKSLEEHAERQAVPHEKKEVPPFKGERASAWHREANEVPLDLSDRGKPKSSRTPGEDSLAAPRDAAGARGSPDEGAATAPSSPSRLVRPSSSTPPGTRQEDEHSYKVIKEREQKEEASGKTNHSGEKKLPVLTISLRPVVVLESLNSALHMPEALSSNGKSSPSPPPAEPRSSSDEVESVLGQESGQSCKRRRSAVETGADLDSDSDNAPHERKIKFTLRGEEKSAG